MNNFAMQNKRIFSSSGIEEANDKQLNKAQRTTSSMAENTSFASLPNELLSNVIDFGLATPQEYKSISLVNKKWNSCLKACEHAQSRLFKHLCFAKFPHWSKHFETKILKEINLHPLFAFDRDHCTLNDDLTWQSQYFFKLKESAYNSDKAIEDLMWKIIEKATTSTKALTSEDIENRVKFQLAYCYREQGEALMNKYKFISEKLLADKIFQVYDNDLSYYDSGLYRLAAMMFKGRAYVEKAIANVKDVFPNYDIIDNYNSEENWFLVWFTWERMADPEDEAEILEEVAEMWENH